MSFDDHLQTFCEGESTNCVYGRAICNFRILYFFHGKNVAILGHALTKEDKIPNGDIEKAIRRKRAFELDPIAHTYWEEDGR